jgi:hypothetical protein
MPVEAAEKLLSRSHLLLLLLTPLLLLLLLHCWSQQARIRAAGGQVFYHNGCRVMGALAMTRAIGDHALRPYGELAAGMARGCCILLSYHAAPLPVSCAWCITHLMQLL